MMRFAWPLVSDREGFLLAAALSLGALLASDHAFRTAYLGTRRHLMCELVEKERWLVTLTTTASHQVNDADHAVNAPPAGALVQPKQPRTVLRDLERLADERVRILTITPNASGRGVTVGDHPLVVELEGELAPLIDYLARVSDKSGASIETLSLAVAGGQSRILRCRATVVPVARPLLQLTAQASTVRPTSPAAPKKVGSGTVFRIPERLLMRRGR